jgi:hypothetical protein
MKALFALFLPVLLLLPANASRADCVNPAGMEANIIYNKAYRVYQFCDGTDWMSMAAGIRYVVGGNPPTDCPNVGDVCSDGSIFAGLDGGVPLYTTRCDAGMAWSGASCTGGRSAYPWNNGNSTGFVTVGTTGNGAANTAAAIATDSDSITAGVQPHQAAQYCADLIAHGQGDWYLPSKNELNIFYGNKVAIGGFETSGVTYWSSSEHNTNYIWNQRFSDGAFDIDAPIRHSSRAIRCARR